MSRSSNIVSVIAFAGAITCGNGAWAQGAPTGSTGGATPTAGAQPVASGTDGSNGIADIVVTARRVDENAQTVPVTVAAFSADALRKAAISQPQDLQQSVAGIFLGGSGSPANSNYSIRGATKPVAGAGAPGVVTYFANVPLAAYVSSTPQYDLGSIQVLKGPQGTLFGRNTVGGALLIDPVAPGYAFDGYVQASYGNYDTRSLEGAVNVPIVDGKVALRAAGRLDRADGYVKNLGSGPDFNDQHDNNFRGSLLVEPTDWLKNLTIYDYAEQPKGHATGAAPIAVSTGIPAFQPLVDTQRARGPYTTDAGTLAAYSGWRAQGITNRTDVDFGSISITNIFGFRKVYNENVSNFDGLPGPVFDTYQLVRNKQYSDELQVKGELFDDRLQWLLGGFYLNSPDGTIAYDSDLALLGAPNGPLGYNFYSEKSKALFVNLSFEVVDGVTINGGYRYTWDSYASCSGTGNLDAPPQQAPGDCPSGLDAGSAVEGKSKAPTWTIGVDWKVSDALFVYATSRRGYKSGGINAPALGVGLAAVQTFAPEKTTDIEIGAKSDFTIGNARVRLNGSLFRAKTKGLQIIGTSVATSTFQAAGLACVAPNFSPFIDGDCNPLNDPIQTVITINGGDVVRRGAEVEATISPTRRLVLSGNATFLGSKTRRQTIPGVLAPFFPEGDIPLLFTPKTSYSGNVSYTVPLPGQAGELAFNAQYYHSGAIDFSNLIARPYDVVNAKLDWNGVFGTSLDASLFAKNLFKEEYIFGPGLTPVNAIPVATALFGAPRTYGIQLRYRFGAAAR
jgi:iron complex outermembrane receptor protein